MFATFLQPLVDLNDAILKFWHDDVGLSWGLAIIGLTVVIFVILGNPSAGGAYQAPMLPTFWRAISGYLPNSAGTDAIRRIVYFESHGLTHPIVVLAAWIVGGVALTLVASAITKRARQ